MHKRRSDYFNNAKALADELIFVKNDHQRILKGSIEFQNEQELKIIVSNIISVDYAIPSLYYNCTVCSSLEKVALSTATVILYLLNGSVKTMIQCQRAMSVVKPAST